jgi:DNA adenine methylase
MSTKPKSRKSERLVQWFGSGTDVARNVGDLLAGCRMVYIPFCGGCSEVPWIDAKQILCNDLHRHVVNLCRVVKDDESRKWLAQQADALPYHPDELARHQEAASRPIGSFPSCPDQYAALAYFVCVWMGRGGKAGTASEFNGSLPIRWNASGGGSNRRYRTAIEALDSWGETFRRCEFTCMDAFDFLAKCQDEPMHGLYVDCNWPGAGEEYRHKIDEAGQRRLASVLSLFQQARVVVRFGDHPLIRSLYLPEFGWAWRTMASRNQANDVNTEFLITRNL